ncbi:hypothetical protein GGR50DRAFT_206813 [Xylaria sp. CBS 124048]|nr:hypothetical protein GGR50DRAFT_206813 [Xylaria sp. CBS 124048]
MKLSLVSQALGAATLVAGLPSLVEKAPANIDLEDKAVLNQSAPLLQIEGMAESLVTFRDALKQFATAPKAKSNPATYNDTMSVPAKNFATASTAAAGSCTNPSIRYEWDNYPTADRQALMTAFKCLMTKAPSGKFPAAKSRWEDFVSLHQMYTPNVHNNQKFLPWHRYLIYTFEQALRNECSFTGPMFWFDETKHSGSFQNSDLFTSQYLGSLRNNANYCVNDGQFAGLTINVGPGNQNTPHCLSRNGDIADTLQCNTIYVNMCMANSRYKDFERCFEYGPHGYGHNGVGGVMADVYASPAEPFFWFHHGFVDRAWRIWELADPTNRYAYIDGTDINGNPISLDTVIAMAGVQPDVTIRQVINTQSGDPLCYRYNY